MHHLELLTVLHSLNTACLKCKQHLSVFSSEVVEGLCHTWALIPHEGTGTSGLKAKGKAQRTRRQAGHTCAPATSEVVKGEKASPPQRTPTHRRAPLSSSDETLPRCPCMNALIRTANKSGDKNKKDCIQTRISEQAVTQTALFRGGERVRATRRYSCNLSKTVGERKHCLWFKAQANKMGDGALCLLSAVRLECKAVRMKGVWKESSWCCMNTDVYLKNASIAFFQMN